MEFKVFISYSSNDLRHIDELKSRLNGTGVSVFVAEHSVTPSENLKEEITKAIDSCDLFVLCWSANARESQWVSQEIGIAKAKGKKILPIILDDTQALPGFVQDLKYLRIVSNEDFYKARDIVVALAQGKETKIKGEKEKQRDGLILLGLGILILWLFSKGK